MAQELEIRLNEPAKRFETGSGDEIGFLQFRLSESKMIFLHTEVPIEWEGRGIGGALARAGLEYARQHSLRVVALCPFVNAYMRRHPETLDLLDRSGEDESGE
jgi:hypothetical protein